MTLQKVKVYELAKELGIESMALLEKLKQLDIDVKSHMSSLGTEEAKIVKEQLAKERAVVERATKAAAKKASPSTEEKRVTSTVIRRRSRASDTASEVAPPAATTTTKRRRAPQHEEAPQEAATHLTQESISGHEPASYEEQPSPDAVSVAETVQEQTAYEAPSSEQFTSDVEEPTVSASSERAIEETYHAPATQQVPESSPEPLETKKQAQSTQPEREEIPVMGQGPDFDIIKVISKDVPAPAPRAPLTTAPTRPSTASPVVRPRTQIQITQKAAPTAAAPLMPPPVRPLKPGEVPQRSFQGRGGPAGTYNRGPAGPGMVRTPGGPTGGPGISRGPGTSPGFNRSPGGGGPGGFNRGPGGFSGGPGFGRSPMGGSGLPPSLPGGPLGSRHGHDRPRSFVSEEELAKRKGTGREETPVEDIKLTDYRAKKELIFIGKRKRVPLNRELKRTEITKPAAHKRVIKVDGSLTVSELADCMGIKSKEVIKKLIAMGVMAGLNQNVDLDTASLIATEFGFEVENVAFSEDTIIVKDDDKDEEKQPRPPIVTVMGHVDHGKTSLLDAIRSAKVAAGEAGGITQHIGAYSIQAGGKPITFIDTPGHEAFTLMRARGANVTDIVILVVAADDGIMPQTREAIDHARGAGVPIIVAINKIDKPNANRDKVLKQLAEADLLAEEWGGEIMTVDVSALKQTGIKELLDAILLQAEVLDLKANPNRLAEGSILEARLDKNRGPVATVIVKRGTLKIGDNLVAGVFTGRVRAMTGAHGQILKEIGPSMAAEVLGIQGVPTSGDNFNAVKDEAAAQDLQTHRIEEQRRKDASKGGKLTLEEIFGKIQKGDLKELPIILKTDVFGSTEALKDSLNKLSNEKVKVKLLSVSVGGITESDVLLASASKALILGFNVRPDNKARQLAEQEGIEVKMYSIIYELIDDVRKAMTGLLPKQAVERYLGRAEVRSLFSVPNVGVVAGSAVIDGKILRNANVRLLRENRVVFTGKISSLRRFKDDAKEVAQGYECGIGIENYRDLKLGDVIEAYTIDMVAQELNSPSPSQPTV